MTSVVRPLATHAADEVGLLPDLLALPGLHPAMCMTAQVIAARGSFLVAQLPVCSPGLIVDPDHAAGGSLRRHVDRVADPSMPTHPAPLESFASVLLMPTHPAVLSKHAERPAEAKTGDPMGLVPCAPASQICLTKGTNR